MTADLQAENIEPKSPLETVSTEANKLASTKELDSGNETALSLMSEQAAGRELTESEEESDQPKDGEGHVMSVIEHLEELRMCIIRSFFAVLIGISVALCFGKDILRILKAPAGNIQFQALSLEEPILVYLKVSFYSGLVLAAPFILNEICRFIAPGLTKTEKKVVLPVIVCSPLLFFAGAAFAYFCVLPGMLHFFASFGEGVIQVNQRLDFYVSLVSSFLLYMGLCFQLPLVICALSFTGLVTSKHLLKFWRYAIFGAGILAAVVTPDPTAFSMLVTMAALVALYGLSIILVKFFGK
ncbi:MAG TPA: twin-arginine translocase subunit TatC [Candidatus Melainabacteria bacterium]|nr:twin-arginine translocase subunit TatC [Candidatus Melainabacteria bacterium]HIN67050.1 twin-arginine translocase subunit TatC [Candidatus Obscuribacterales bacterium]